MSTGWRVLLVEPAASGGLHAHVEDEITALTGLGWAVERADVDIRPRPDPRADLATVRKLRAALRDGQVDAVHAHGLRAGALTGLARGPRRRRTPRVVVTLHNRTTGSRAARALGAALLWVVARSADVVLAVSPDLADAARAAGAADVRPAVIPARPPAAVVPSGPVGPGPLRVLTIARLAPQKGLSTLLDAAAICARRAPGAVTVSVAGDGPERTALAARIAAERLPVVLLGRRPDIAALLAAADVVVSAAVWEGQPVALQEALHAGRAIVATDAGGTREVTGRAAALVPVGDAEALAAAVLALRDPGARRRAEEASRARAALLPGPDALASQLRAVLVPPLSHG